MKKILFILFIFLIFANPVFAQSWYNSSWHMRVPVNISYASDMDNASVNITLNFTQLLEQLGVSGTFDQNSIRVVETTEEIPHDFYNTTIDTGNVSWVANGTTPANTNRTFLVYFDVVESGVKTVGKIITESPYWRSNYTSGMHDPTTWSNQSTYPGIGYEWNRTWAESLEISWKWDTEPGPDWTKIYVNTVYQDQKMGNSSETKLLQGSRVVVEFRSDDYDSYYDPDPPGPPGPYGTEDSYGVYGVGVDIIKFYPTTNYSTPQLTATSGNPEIQNLSITVETDKSSYGYNQSVFISGIVRDETSSSVNASTVNLTVYFPNQTVAKSSILETNSSGIYNDSLTIIETEAGTYSVNVTTNKTYYWNGTNSTTFYYTANRVPVLENESVTPSTGGWGENFNYSVDVSDYENDEVNVTLWINVSGVWVKNETNNITPPGTLNWNIAPFSISDIGYNRSYMFEYRDANSSWQNTSQFDNPLIEKDDIILEYLSGNNTSADRNINNITLGIRLKDIDRNSYLDGESVTFWVYYYDTWNNVSSNTTNSDGNATFDFYPNCSVESGNHNWKVNYTGSYYQNNQSDLFSFNVTGQLKNYLQLPTNGSTYNQGDIIDVRGNLTDECLNLISNANVNFSLISSTEYFCDVNDEGTGWYNCSWDSQAKNVGYYNITMNSSISNYSSNSTTWINRFQLTGGLPEITIIIYPEETEQENITQINATVIDQSGTGINWVRINVTRPDSTLDQENMTNLSSTLWTIYYNNTWGNTSSRGIYNVSVYAADNSGNRGNSSSNFTIYIKLNITMNTLSSSYYQGDVGSIYFKSTNISDNAIENVNTTLIITSSNNVKIFNNSYSTNADGLIEPLPQFTISSDATLGNYTVNSSSSYYDNIVSIIVNKTSSYNFTVYEKTAAEMLMLDLACPAQEALGNNLEVSATVKTGLTNIDPDSILVSLYDSADDLIMGPIAMDQISTGLYNSNKTTSTSSNQGNWKWVVNVTNAGNMIVKECYTRLVGGPFDVKNINVIDNTIPELSVSVDIENTGDAGQDVSVQWNLTRVDSGEELDSGGDTVYVGPSSTLTHPVTPGEEPDSISYVGDVKITFVVTYSGTERAAAYETFTTTTAPPTEPTGYAAGGGGIVSYAAPVAKLEIIEYEKEILIEMGWIKYLSVKVKNSGDEYLHNVEISIDGEKSYWFEIQTNKTDLAPNETASFIVKLYVAFDEEKGTYYFFLNANSDETSTKKSFTTRVFTSRAEMILYQIQSLRDNINDLEESADNAEKTGKNVTSVKNLLFEGESLLDVAEDYVYSEMYDEATEKIRDSEDLIRKAEYELSIAPTISIIPAIPFEWILIIILIIIIIAIILLFFILTRRKTERRVPGLKIKKLMLETKEVKELEEEVESLREAESLLEEEYKEGLISKESYEELKSKYEEKILDIQTKTKK